MPQKLKQSNTDVLDPVPLRASVDGFDVIFDEIIEKKSTVRYNCTTAAEQNVAETMYISREAWARLGKPERLKVSITTH